MSVWTSAGAEARSGAELGLLKLEQMKLVRSANTAAASRSKEYDAAMAQTDEWANQAATKGYQEAAAGYAKDAAAVAMITALAGAAGGAASSISNIGKSASTALKVIGTLVALTGAVLSSIGPVVKFLSTSDEYEALKQQSKELKVAMSDELSRAEAIRANPAM